MGAILDASHEAAALLEAVIASETSDFGQGTWDPDGEVCRFGPGGLSFFPTPSEAKMGAFPQHREGEAVEGAGFSGTLGPRIGSRSGRFDRCEG